jgi:hypothetical protein
MTAVEPRVLRWVERRHIHEIHRVSLGLLFVWFGLLKPFGLRTTTSLLANTVYVSSPEVVVPILGWWEVAIGLFLLKGKLVKLAVGLLLVRLPGTILALVLMRDVCFVHFPLAPTPEGQYLIKDLVVFFACLAVALPAANGAVHETRDSSDG